MEIIGASILVSVITTKILATYYFKKVDGYVKDILITLNCHFAHTVRLGVLAKW